MQLAWRHLMPRKRSLVCADRVCCWVRILVGGSATAQEPDLDAIIQLMVRGDHAAALLKAQKLEAAAKAQFGINHTSYAYALNVLATVYMAQEKPDEAEGLYRRALAIREHV